MVNLSEKQGSQPDFMVNAIHGREELWHSENLISKSIDLHYALTVVFEFF